MRYPLFIFISLLSFCSFAQGKKTCNKKVFSQKLRVNDTLFISQNYSTGSEKIGIIKLSDGRYKALQYGAGSSEIFQDFTVPSTVFETVIKEEKALKKKSKTKCKEISYTFQLKKKYYSIGENNCDNTALDKMKAQLFLVQSN